MSKKPFSQLLKGTRSPVRTLPQSERVEAATRQHKSYDAENVKSCVDWMASEIMTFSGDATSISANQRRD